MKKSTLRTTRAILHWLSGEWILVNWGVPNGGAVVFLRSLYVTIIVFIAAFLADNLLEASGALMYPFSGLGVQIANHLTWLGVIFAGVYTAFYTRFASQWTYLATLYNNIKAAEVAGGDREALAEWKAGFIEDAQALHMECKSSFVSVIAMWLKDEDVVKAFTDFAIGGSKRLADLRENLEFSNQVVEQAYQRRINRKARSARSDDAA